MAARAEVVRIALAELGRAEPTGDDKYIEWFNKRGCTALPTEGTDWCCIWATWVYSAAGVDTMPLTAGCTTARGWLMRHGQWRGPGDYTPRPGDAICFDWDGSGDCDHVGIVERVAGGTVHTVEGNSNYAVRRRAYALSDARIAGYGLPEFEEEAEKMEDFGGAPGWLIDEGAAEWLTANGVFKGDEAGSMKWDEPITRAECGALIFRLAKLLGEA